MVNLEKPDPIGKLNEPYFFWSVILEIIFEIFQKDEFVESVNIVRAKR